MSNASSSSFLSIITNEACPTVDIFHIATGAHLQRIQAFATSSKSKNNNQIYNNSLNNNFNNNTNYYYYNASPCMYNTSYIVKSNSNNTKFLRVFMPMETHRNDGGHAQIWFTTTTSKLFVYDLNSNTCSSSNSSSSSKSNKNNNTAVSIINDSSVTKVHHITFFEKYAIVFDSHGMMHFFNMNSLVRLATFQTNINFNNNSNTIVSAHGWRDTGVSATASSDVVVVGMLCVIVATNNSLKIFNIGNVEIWQEEQQVAKQYQLEIRKQVERCTALFASGYFTSQEALKTPLPPADSTPPKPLIPPKQSQMAFKVRFEMDFANKDDKYVMTALPYATSDKLVQVVTGTRNQSKEISVFNLKTQRERVILRRKSEPRTRVAEFHSEKLNLTNAFFYIADEHVNIYDIETRQVRKQVIALPPLASIENKLEASSSSSDSEPSKASEKIIDMKVLGQTLLVILYLLDQYTVQYEAWEIGATNSVSFCHIASRVIRCDNKVLRCNLCYFNKSSLACKLQMQQVLFASCAKFKQLTDMLVVTSQ